MSAKRWTNHRSTWKRLLVCSAVLDHGLELSGVMHGTRHNLSDLLCTKHVDDVVANRLIAVGAEKDRARSDR